MKWLLILPFVLLTGCGTYVPSLTLLGDDQLFTINVHDSIQCETIDAVKRIQSQIVNVREATVFDTSISEKDKKIRLKSLKHIEHQFIEKWGLLYSATLSIVEDSSINPSLEKLSPATPTSMLLPGDKVLTINTGLTVTTKATRKETTQVFFTIKELMRYSRCDKKAPKNRIIPFGNNLKLSDWAVRQFALVTSGLIISLDPTESMTYEVKFDIGKRGNLDPTWTFIQSRLNKKKGLFNAGRASSHSVIFTLGPTKVDRKKLEQSALAVHNARLIGDAIAN